MPVLNVRVVLALQEASLGLVTRSMVQVDSLSLQVHYLRQSVWLALDQSPKSQPVAPSRVQEALLAKTAWGGSLGRKPLSVHLGNSASKAQLRRSDMDSDLLFESSSAKKAIGQVQQVPSVLLIEAAAKAPIKAKPRLGTPLVEKHSSCLSTSAESHPHPGPTQQRSSKPYFPQFWMSLFETVKEPDISEMTPLLLTSSIGGCLA
ncbi:hypothetical protein E2C01_049777 [Portunus trituberculatus]|uniref:Uncharacterized protein n=1 Tax=Portunus trituberculatus TaxID=210409 RepID=A0A5B7GAD0_PORTR|nr:hypothetical protein [Portunus trituberculatus]